MAVAAMVCFLLVLLGQKGYSVWFTPVSTISIDVNPSIELDINRFERVIGVESYTEDGDRIVSSVNIRFLDYREALELLLRDENMTPYLTEEQLVVITVFGTDEQRNTEMLENLTACTDSYKNIHCSSGHSDEVEDAHSLGLSCGKYKAFLELQALDPDVTVEDIKELTMRQLQDRIHALSGGGSCLTPDHEEENHKEEDYAEENSGQKHQEEYREEHPESHQKEHGRGHDRDDH